MSPNSESRRLLMMNKVAKLMDKASSATELGNLQEAEAFTLGVQRLMGEYNLTEWEISENRPEEVSAFKIENTTAERISYDDSGITGRPGGTWQLQLWDMLMPNFGCSRVAWAKSKTIALFGTADNIRSIRYVFGYLNNLLPKLALLDWRAQKLNKNRYQYMRNWIDGAIVGLANKLGTERRARQSANNNVQALAIYNASALMEARDEIYGKLKNSKTHKVQWTDAAHKGYEKGKSLQIAPALEQGEVKQSPKSLN